MALGTRRGAAGSSQAPAEPQLVQFNFDARHKSIVPQVFEQEAKQLKKFFKRKPKVSLHQLENALKNHAGQETVKQMVTSFTASYYSSADAHLFFESAGRLLLEAAAKEMGDVSSQRFLLTNSLEMLYLALQKTPKMVSVPVQSLVVSVLKVLGKNFQENYLIERHIHKEMATMINVRRDPSDFNGREKIIKLYLQEKQYYEALLHMVEYEKTMQAKSRPLYHQKQGELAFRKASLFQAMIDHFNSLLTSKSEEGGLFKEAQRLQSFVFRFNRDNTRINIISLKGTDPIGIQKTLLSMSHIANGFYTESTKSRTFTAAYKSFFFMSRNHYVFDDMKKALHNLAEGKRILDTSRLPAKQRDSEKMKFLEFEYRIYMDQGQKRKAEEVGQEINRVSKAMRSTKD